MKPAAKKGCYVATAYDDNGKAATVAGLVVARRLEDVDRRHDEQGVCPGPHKGVLVRATATGAVRSNAVK